MADAKALQPLAIGLAGAVIADWLGIPAGLFIGSLIAVAVSKIMAPDLGEAATASAHWLARYLSVGPMRIGTAAPISAPVILPPL